MKNGKGRSDKVQRYLCRRCDKRFSSSGVIDSNRYPANHIGAAIRMFYSGMSYKQIAENMVEMYDIPEPSKATIYRWVKEYTADALREMENHKAETGDEWMADEAKPVEIPKGGNPKSAKAASATKRRTSSVVTPKPKRSPVRQILSRHHPQRNGTHWGTD